MRYYLKRIKYICEKNKVYLQCGKKNWEDT